MAIDKEYQQRVVNERINMDQKRARLIDFITSQRYKTLSDKEQERMQRQSVIMREYSEILIERIAAF